MMQMFIFERPLYKVFVFLEDGDIDIDIRLTVQGVRYAEARARGYHRRISNDEEAMAEILNAELLEEREIAADNPFWNG
jgi:hypothetical protein